MSLLSVLIFGFCCVEVVSECRHTANISSLDRTSLTAAESMFLGFDIIVDRPIASRVEWESSQAIDGCSRLAALLGEDVVRLLRSLETPAFEEPRSVPVSQVSVGWASLQRPAVELPALVLSLGEAAGPAAVHGASENAQLCCTALVARAALAQCLEARSANTHRQDTSFLETPIAGCSGFGAADLKPCGYSLGLARALPMLVLVARSPATACHNWAFFVHESFPRRAWPRPVKPSGPPRNMVLGSRVYTSIRAPAPASRCRFKLQLLLLQEATLDFWMRERVVAQTAQLQRWLGDTVAEVEMAVATFTDKPLGSMGQQAGRGGFTQSDWCYRLESAFSRNPEEALCALRDARAGDGADDRNAQLEALLRAALDKDAGWAPATADVDPRSRLPVLKLLLMVTDSLMHQAGNAVMLLDEWNEFYGDPDWCESGVVAPHLIPECVRLGTLRHIIWHKLPTERQIREFERLAARVGPYPHFLPDDHPGNLSRNDDCARYDYPPWQRIREELEAQRIHTLFAVPSTDEGVLRHWQWLAGKFRGDVKSTALQLSPDLSDFAFKIFAVFEQLRHFACQPLPLSDLPSNALSECDWLCH
eukprot:Gregarina_sp_Pseudo_9__124@NODE_1084_length_1886_cov_15_351922_g1015_i0_p1_GENE_NODE_1084_length_1886_cov_15_351922_g1015_i0NODE_1084_length_1886_cov_15_351922_g1015_i0_p1_ORF_typecomplete_len592_score152_54Integrin_beta/PF00362_18/8_2e03Integrin_beta/PF00362_18/1_2e07Integrin_beta/PF00362_18/0_021_NODE_1084_length_1886_cov_15_351922_g1015_i0211796